MFSIVTPTITSLGINVRTFYNYINNARSSNKLIPTNTVILDPLTAIFKICLLKYKAKDTKIGIHSNRIVFYDPVVYQGVSRWFAGDSRNDVQYLYLPVLIFACIKHKYIETMFDNCANRLDVLNKINKMLHGGLVNLHDLYNVQGSSNIIAN